MTTPGDAGGGAGNRATLLGWLADPSAERGVSHATEQGDWERVTYRELASKVFEIARHLAEVGAQGAIVPILMPSGPRFVATFFGVLLAGGTPAPLVTPVKFEDPQVYNTYLHHLLSTTQARIVVAEARFAKRILEVVAPRRPEIIVIDDGFSARPPYDRAVPLQVDDIGLLQFSSGSSGKNRAVRVPVGSLEANTNAMARWLDLAAGRDAWATWLPVHHDLGLVAGVVTPVMHGLDLWSMPPERFIREPRKWLGCFGELGATVTAAPPFGLGYVARKLSSADLDGMDFSRWKAVICGAERVSAHVLADFGRVVGPLGFDERAILPAYGMAEATLVVTGKEVGAPTRKIRVASASLRMGQTVEVIPSPGRENWHVGCGRIVDPGTTAEIVLEESPVGERVVGEIVVSGTSLAAGYYTNTIDGTSRFADGKLFTGDAGFLHEGELFVVGRLGDSVKVRGKSLFAEDTDATLHSVDGLGTHNAVTLLGFLDDRESIVALVEKPAGEWVDKVGGHLETYHPSMRVVVMTADRGTLLRTTSGKPRRRAMWQLVLDRWEGRDIAFDSDRATASDS